MEEGGRIWGIDWLREKQIVARRENDPSPMCRGYKNHEVKTADEIISEVVKNRFCDT